MKRFFLLLPVVFALLTACNGDAANKTSTETAGPPPIPWERPVTPITAANASGLKLTGRLDGHTSTVFNTVINRSGQRLATIGADGRFIVWNTASGRPVLQAVEVKISAAFFLPDDETVITYGADEQLRKWSLGAGRQIAQVQGHEQGISAAALSLDGTRLAVGGTNGTVTIFETATLEKIGSFTAHRGGFAVQALYFSPNSNVLYTIGGEGNVIGWNTTTYATVRQLESETVPPLGSAVSADGTLLAVARSERLNVYDLSNGERTSSFAIPPFEQIEKMQFSGDKAWLAIGGSIDSVTIFDIASGELVIALREHERDFLGLAFSPQQDLILTGINGGKAYLWNLSQIAALASTGSADQVQIPRATLQQVPNLSLSSLNWSPNGAYIVLADRKGAVYVLSLGSE